MKRRGCGERQDPNGGPGYVDARVSLIGVRQSHKYKDEIGEGVHIPPKEEDSNPCGQLNKNIGTMFPK